MILSFKKQFVEKIKSGQKIHTIREDKKNRWKILNKIHFATGVRTKNYNQFAEGVCTLIERIEIKYTHQFGCKIVSVFINNKPSGIARFVDSKISWSSDCVKALAAREGFDSVEDFFAWFDKDFTGKLLHFGIFKEKT